MLSTKEAFRYSRQIMLKEVGDPGQLKLMSASVLIVGLGGLGSPVASYLAAAGVGRLVLVDGDRLELTNLHRQVLYRTADLLHNKADQARQQLLALNPEIDIEAIDAYADAALLTELIHGVDLVLDCTDNLSARQLINRVCVEHATPLLTAAAIRFEGQLQLVDTAQQTACYHCLVPDDTKLPAGSCQSEGVIGPLLGVVGSMQAQAALNLLLGLPSGLEHKLKLYDAKQLAWHELKTRPMPHCPVCGVQR